MSHHRAPGRHGQLDTAAQSVRLAAEGACVPWAALASIERATRDAAERRAASAVRRESRVRTALSWMRRRMAAWRSGEVRPER